MANTVALFLSFDGGELDTQPLIDQLWRAGKSLSAGATSPLAGQSCCFCYHSHSELVVNRLKITEPKLDARRAATSLNWMMITPLVAFDEQGRA